MNEKTTEPVFHLEGPIPKGFYEIHKLLPHLLMMGYQQWDDGGVRVQDMPFPIVRVHTPQVASVSPMPGNDHEVQATIGHWIVTVQLCMAQEDINVSVFDCSVNDIFYEEMFTDYRPALEYIRAVHLLPPLVQH